MPEIDDRIAELEDARDAANIKLRKANKPLAILSVVWSL
jgi:hypothetical protein